MPPLEQNTKKKKLINKLDNNLPELERGFETKNNKKYKVEAIINSAVYC